MPRARPAQRFIPAPELLAKGQKLNRWQNPLWNAHRRIESGKLWHPKSGKYNEFNEDDSCRALVTPDVIDFIDKAQLSASERLRCIKSPNRYFAFPRNVPETLRKQVYFPDFTIILQRTPHLPAKYASFEVPLWFNKLDMKNYLKSVYNVDVLHVRSTVLQQKVVRDLPNGQPGYSNQGTGRLRRPKSKKKMTVELLEPFAWPKEIDDMNPWDQDAYFALARNHMKEQRRTAPDAITKPPEEHRKSIAQQAKEVLDGKAKWKPTWQLFPADVRAMKGTETLSKSLKSASGSLAEPPPPSPSAWPSTSTPPP